MKKLKIIPKQAEGLHPVPVRKLLSDKLILSLFEGVVDTHNVNSNNYKLLKQNNFISIYRRVQFDKQNYNFFTR